VSDGLRNVYWRPWDDPGLEQLNLQLDADGARALGLILLMRDGAHFRCRYRLETDAAWRLRRLTFAVADAEDTAVGRAVVECDGAGHWRVNEQERPDLDGCVDVDIQITPFTNTLPIRRLSLAPGESAEIRVAYLPVPELAPRPAEQRYTCLAPRGAAGGRFRYEGLFRGFTADLPVDGDGLVMDYPETFRRVWPT